MKSRREAYQTVLKMTDEQVAALNHFGGVNAPVGAVWFEHRWIFRQDLRADADLASRYINSVQLGGQR